MRLRLIGLLYLSSQNPRFHLQAKAWRIGASPSVKRSGSLVLQYLTKIYPYVIYPLRDHDKHYGFLPVNIQVYFWY